MRDWPYGLQGLSAIDAQGRGGLGQAAEEILARLRQLPADGVLEAPRPRTRRELLNAALHLNRSDQWGAIQKIARGSEHAYFLLYGQTFQNLRLFIERILHRLGKEVRAHLVLELPYRLDNTRPANVHEWEHRLLWALKQRLNRQGSLDDLLRSAAQTQPIFLVTTLGWNEVFDPPHQRALQTFLESRLPELMIAGGGRGIRLLLAAEYFQRETSRHPEITAWMRRAATAGTVRYEPMAEVETPSRGDVVVYLQRLGFDEGHPELDEVMRGYDQLATDPRLDFRSLSDFLDAQLGDPAAAGEDEEEYE